VDAKNPTFTKALNSQKSTDMNLIWNLRDMITCFLIPDQKLALRKHAIINANPCAHDRISA